MMRVRVLVFSALLSALAGSAVAQIAVQPGERIRVDLTDGRFVTGRLLSWSSDSVLLDHTGARNGSALPLSTIESLQRSLGGRKNATLKGAALGLVAGAAGFGLYYRKDDAMLGYTLVGSAAGSALGMVLGGGVLGRERWQPVDLHAFRARAMLTDVQRRELYVQSHLNELERSGPVRIRTHDGREIQGVFIGTESGQAQVLGDTAHAIPLTNIITIRQLQPATMTYARRGAVAGVVAGGLLFLLPLAFDTDDCSIEGSCVDPAGQIAALAPLGMLGGGVTGFLLGALIGSTTKRWQTIR
jgi:hypothetical protein